MHWKVLVLAAILSGVQILIYFLFKSFGWILPAFLFVSNLSVIYLLVKRVYNTQKISLKNIGGHIDPTLQIADETLPYLCQGLNKETAQKIAEIIQKISQVPAVAITNREKVLAYIGEGCNHHHPGDRILTKATEQAIKSGQHKIVRTTRELLCRAKSCNCPLTAAIIVPLKCRGITIGTVKLYQTKNGTLPPHVIRLAFGIASLLSMQVELAELDRQNQLVTQARLEALHAQINPHFLFNTLNTIVMYSRTDSEKARTLLINLANFFRRTLKRQGQLATLGEELEYINTYFVLEKARFGDKLQLVEEVPEEFISYKVPVLSLQPLIENAVKHGIIPKTTPGKVKITAYLEKEDLVIKIHDNGVGIPADVIPHILKPGFGSGNGVGLYNVHERLKNMFGEKYGLTFKSSLGRGTTVWVRVPSMTAAENNWDLPDEKEGA